MSGPGEIYDRADNELRELKQSLDRTDISDAYQADIDRIREELEFVIEDYERRERTLEAVANE